jgi:hypothetical protein
VFAQLEGQERTFVRTTFVRIKERLAEFARPAEVRSESSRAPLGAVSNFLGSLVAAATGSGAASALVPNKIVGGDLVPSSGGATTSEPATTGGSTDDPKAGGISSDGQARRGRPSIRLDGEPYFEDTEVGVLLVQDMVVVGNGHLVAQGTAGITVADGSREQEPPAGSEEPVVIGWRAEADEERGDVITLPNATAGMRLSLVVRPVPDTITQVDVSVVREGASPGGR